MTGSWQPRFRIGSLMLVIVGFALISAVATWSVPAALAVVVWPTVLFGLSVGWARSSGGTRLRAAVWLCAAYPWFALASLVGMIMALNFKVLDEGSPGNTTLQLVASGVKLALSGTFSLGIAEIFGTMDRVEAGRESRLALSWLILVPIASWVGAFMAFIVVASAIPHDY